MHHAYSLSFAGKEASLEKEASPEKEAILEKKA